MVLSVALKMEDIFQFTWPLVHGSVNNSTTWINVSIFLCWSYLQDHPAMFIALGQKLTCLRGPQWGGGECFSHYYKKCHSPITWNTKENAIMDEERGWQTARTDPRMGFLQNLCTCTSKIWFLWKLCTSRQNFGQENKAPLLIYLSAINCSMHNNNLHWLKQKIRIQGAYSTSFPPPQEDIYIENDGRLTWLRSCKPGNGSPKVLSESMDYNEGERKIKTCIQYRT